MPTVRGIIRKLEEVAGEVDLISLVSQPTSHDVHLGQSAVFQCARHHSQSEEPRRQPALHHGSRDDTFDLMVEGHAIRVRGRPRSAAWPRCSPRSTPGGILRFTTGPFYPDDPGGLPFDVYRVTPTLAFGFGKRG